MRQAKIILDEIVPARKPWGARIAANDVLTIIDLEGQQAVDFLCYDGGQSAGPLLRHQHGEGPGQYLREGWAACFIPIAVPP